MNNERDVKKKLVAALKSIGAWYCMPHGAGYGRAGIPDIIACIDGRFFAFECKFGKNKPTAHQAAELRDIARAGGAAGVVDETNINEVISSLRALSSAR